MSILSVFSRWFRRLPPQEQFVVDVVKELRRRGIEGVSYNHQEYSLLVQGRRMGLGNMFLEWRLRGRSDKAILVRRFVNSVFEIPADLSSYDAVADKLVPLVRSRFNICIWLLENQSDGAPPGKVAETAWAPLVGDLVTAVGLDRDDGISRMTWANLEHLGVTFDAAFQRALENFRRQAPRLVFTEVGQGMPRGVYHSGSAADYQSSMLLLPERMPALPEGDGDLVVMAAGRNSMWITGSRNEAGLSALLDVGEKSLAGVHHRCSAMLLRLDAGRWTAFTPESSEALKTRYLALRRQQDAVDYEMQKAVLDKVLQVRNDPAYVANFRLAVKDETSWSFTSWASHADSMLPRADKMVLVDQIVDDAGLAIGTKGSIEVAWDEAYPLVQHLMEGVPDLHPPRYRVRRFPDAAVLDALAERGVRHPGRPPAAHRGG